jgi:nitrate/TMAO reductase-like tetraheme cytochrome c subunit
MRWVIGSVAALTVVAALFVGTAFYTDQPQFCMSCHEMKPYYDAWAAGPHKSQWCVDCHVGKSYPARMAHKFAALQEVVAHFSGDTSFPRQAAAPVADTNCSACHASIPPKLAQGFDHSAHAQQGPCEACHGEAGHRVTQSALTAVNVYNPAVVRIPLGSAIATVGAGRADVTGHVVVICTQCHDLAKTGCQKCHVPTHVARGACETCHKAGAKWVFTHPEEAKCELCHDVPAKHFKPASGSLTPCTSCHDKPGKAWSFKHPASNAKCDNCHALPANHFQPPSGALPACQTCHKQTGVAWKWAHPGVSANCESCHTPPAGHSPGQCSQCHHQTGVSFAFAHPAVSAPHGIGGRTCVQCHPAGYETHSCTCHN